MELYNLIKDDLIGPYKESMKSDFVTANPHINKKFEEIYEKINDSMWKLKTRIAMKTNEVNSSLVYQISPAAGLNLTADINKHLGLGMGTNNWSVSAGLSNIYPRGFVVRYATSKQLDTHEVMNLSSIPGISNMSYGDKFLDKTTKGYCYSTKTYNTTSLSTDGIVNSTMTTEYHTNADCIIGAAAIVVAPQIAIPTLGGALGPTVLFAPALASADQTKRLTLADKFNSGTNPKLNYKIIETLNDTNMVNKMAIPTKSPCSKKK